MYDLAKSVVSFAWAMSVVGLQETVGMMQGSQASGQSDKAASTLDSATQAARDELGDLYKAAFEAGDQVQRRLLDSMSHYLSAENFYNPDRALQTGTQLISDLSETLRFFVPAPNTLTAWQEIRNKVGVYQLVRDVEKTLRIPREGELDLKGLVEKAYELGPYPALWAVEGLGHDYADSLRERGEELDGILRGDRIASLPEKSLTMLNAGIGMSFAQGPLADINSRNVKSDLAVTVEQFVQRCHDNATPGYEGAALESLGLVTRTFHNDLVLAVDRHLADHGKEIQGYFWHGVGRATYFLLVNFLPFGDPVWRAVQMGRAQAPHDLARLNSLSGTAWALNLVNMRQPEVMSSFLREYGDELAPEKKAFTNGIASSIIMRYDTSPDDPTIESFRNYQPASDREHLSDLWTEYIKAPIDQALDEYYDVLQKAGKLGEIFRYQPLAALTRTAIKKK